MITQEHTQQLQDSRSQSFSHADQQRTPALPPGSIYSDEEVIVLGPWQQTRQRLLAPVAYKLTKLGISANMLSYASVLLGLAFCLLVAAGIAWAGLIHPALAVLFVYSYTALAILLVLHRLLAVSSAGILRPSRMVFFAAVALYFFLRADLLNVLLLLYLPALPLLCLSFWRVRKAL